MKYRPSRDLPKFALEYKTTQPTKLAEIVLRERNTEITPQAVSMWFSRHPEIAEDLELKLVASQIEEKEVDPSIFKNGTFEALSSVKTWLEEMQDRKLCKAEISNRIAALKRVCQGYKLKDPVLKHPDRLTLDEARAYVRARQKQGVSINKVRIALRDFFPSKSITVGKKISGSKASGKYSKLYLSPEKTRIFLERVKAFNFEAYVVDLFEVKTGTRISSVLNALIENINRRENYITVFDKGRRSKYPKGHPWDKHLDKELIDALNKIIGGRTEGVVFQVSKEEVRNINRAILQGMLTEEKDPDTRRMLKMCLKLPTHWLRHEFFQHCLHTTKWKYGVCAALGGSTVKSLEESYGQPPKAIVQQWGEEWLDKITV